MRLTAKRFSLPKKGSSEDEYEDACSYALDTGRAAIADGAAESSFAREWAESLVSSFVSGNQTRAPIPDESGVVRWLAPSQQEWTQAIPWGTLPWYAEEKARAGAFAAFLGVHIDHATSDTDATCPNASGWVWSAIACGDSCLFHVRVGRMLCSFPVSSSAAFGNRPALLSSLSTRNRKALAETAWQHGEFYIGDLLVLATDALSCWILAEVERGVPPWEALMDVSSADAFRTLIESLRLQQRIKNDDVTLLVVKTTDD